VDLHVCRTTHKDELMFQDESENQHFKIIKNLDIDIRINDNRSLNFSLSFETSISFGSLGFADT
jgi:hypothetical protein